MYMSGQKRLQMQESYAALLAVALSWTLSVVVSFRMGRSVGKVSCKYRLPYTPSRAAFGIWLVIYAGGLAAIIYQLATSPILPLANWLYAGAWVGTTLWLPLFSKDTGLTLILAAVVLATTATSGVAASVATNVWRGPDVDEVLQLAIGIPFSLLAGWTLTATSLSVGIAWLANDGIDVECTPLELEQQEATIYNALPSSGNSSPVPLLLSLAVAPAAVALSDPVLTLPVAWAVANMSPSVGNWVALLVLLTASLLALVT